MCVDYQWVKCLVSAPNLVVPVALFTLAGCKESSIEHLSMQGASVTQTIGLKPYSLDTTIILATSNHLLSNKPIIAKDAELYLYKYFKSRGIKSRFEIGELSDKNAMDDCVRYDTIYAFNTSKLSGAVISYWLGPASVSSNCFWPDKAIILNTNDGYKIIKEQFISSQYVIDSSNSTSIYGTVCECQEDKRKSFKITFK